MNYFQAINVVTAAKAQGFKSEVARKESLRALSNAFSRLIHETNAVCEDVVNAAGATAKYAFYDQSWPLELHQVRDKHCNYLMALTPLALPIVEKVRNLLALREEIKAQALLPKGMPKCEQPVQDGSRYQLRGHCQCCGRFHAAINDHMAKHGYRVKEGFFWDVCPGQSYAPMEICRIQTDKLAAQMCDQAQDMQRKAKAFREFQITPEKAGSANYYGAPLVAYEAAPAFMQEIATEQAVMKCESHARQLTTMAEQLQMLATAYHGKALAKVLA